MLQSVQKRVVSSGINSGKENAAPAEGSLSALLRTHSHMQNAETLRTALDAGAELWTGPAA